MKKWKKIPGVAIHNIAKGENVTTDELIENGIREMLMANTSSWCVEGGEKRNCIDIPKDERDEFAKRYKEQYNINLYFECDYEPEDWKKMLEGYRLEEEAIPCEKEVEV